MKRREALTCIGISSALAAFRFPNCFIPPGERPKSELEKTASEILRERLLEELEKVDVRAKNVGIDLRTLVPADVLVLIQKMKENESESDRFATFIHAWESRAIQTLHEQGTIHGDRWELKLQGPYQTFSITGDPMEVLMARSIPQELFVAYAITKDKALRDRCLQAIGAYCEWNTQNAFTPVGKDALFLHVWRGGPSIDRLDKRNAELVRDLRKEAHGMSSEQKKYVDRAYPMDQWKTFYNFLTGVFLIWKTLSPDQQARYRETILGFLKFWKSKREEFAGLLARYYSNTGDRISDQAAPDDTIARPVGFASDCAVLLEQLGERNAAREFFGFAKDLMRCADEAFYRAGRGVSAGRADIHDILAHLPNGPSEKVREQALKRATQDLPGDGVRMAIARLSLVRSLLLSPGAPQHTQIKKFVSEQILKAVNELNVFMDTASQRTRVLFLETDGDPTSEPKETPPEYLVDPNEILCLSSVFVNPDDKLPTRYLIADGHESGNLEWPIAFGAVWEFCSGELWDALGRYFTRLHPPMRAVLKFKRRSENFLVRMIDSAVRLNVNPQFTKRTEQQRVEHLARMLSQCAKVFGISQRSSKLSGTLRVNPNLQAVWIW